MAKNTGKVREFCQSGKVGTLWTLNGVQLVMQSISRLFVIDFILVIRMDTVNLLVAGVRISISSNYLYLYLRFSGSTIFTVLQAPKRATGPQCPPLSEMVKMQGRFKAPEYPNALPTVSIKLPEYPNNLPTVSIKLPGIPQQSAHGEYKNYQKFPRELPRLSIKLL